MTNLVLFLFYFLTLSSTFAAEICSRKAIINYQEILVDGGANKKGEGLRYYLEKDVYAKDLLNEYQKKNEPTLWAASTSTVGSLMIFSSLLQTNEQDGFQNRNTLLYGGSIMILLSYMITKTTQRNNEVILKNAVDQYNKRNLPRIYFSPYNDSLGVGVVQDF